MGHLPDAEKDRIAGHLEDCPLCFETVRDWTELASSPPIPETPHVDFGMPGAEAAGTDRFRLNTGRQNGEAYPRKRLRKQLMVQAMIRSVRMKLRAHRNRIAGGLAAAFALVLVLGLFGVPEDRSEQEPSMKKIIHDRIAYLQQRPGTEKYVIQPLNRLYDSGSVWIRRESGEMLIVVDGLNSLAEQEYRVWLQDEERLQRAGILVVNGNGPSYYYGHGAGKANKIVVSMEPKGGGRLSARPEAVLVEMDLP